ncbi:MAG: hypothetical protein JWP08_1690 [Bryobacterales bacterium]|nr:hypothetical protein [Bryobacterales bacterium]
MLINLTTCTNSIQAVDSRSTIVNVHFSLHSGHSRERVEELCYCRQVRFQSSLLEWLRTLLDE